MLSCASTPMLEGSASSHCGGTFGQARSTSNTGMERVCALTCATCMQATTINAVTRARHQDLRRIVTSRRVLFVAQRLARTDGGRRGGAAGFHGRETRWSARATGVTLTPNDKMGERPMRALLFAM